MADPRKARAKGYKNLRKQTVIRRNEKQSYASGEKRQMERPTTPESQARKRMYKARRINPR